jgi:peptidoglycan/LPS O-acetylase OafA/YrhL
VNFPSSVARGRRLPPASAAAGVVTAIGSAALLPPLQARSVLEDGIYSALYVSDYRFAHDGVDYFAPVLPPSPFQHYWSLGAEEQFYLVWPASIIGTTWVIRLVGRITRAEGTSSPPDNVRIWWSLRW